MSYEYDRDERLLTLSMIAYEILLTPCRRCETKFLADEGVLKGEDLLCSEWCAAQVSRATVSA